jgi:hypothetical protein
MTQQIRYYKQDGTEYDFSKTLKIRITQTSNADMNIGVQKQKTAMQEAIELVKKYDNREIPMKVLLYNLELLLEKEKEQIMKAYKDHHDLGHIFGLDTEQYYNQTYNL